MKSIGEEIVAMAALLFQRRLLDMAGGNISARFNDQIWITPRYSGARQQWQLSPEDLVIGDIATDEVLSDPAFSREGKAHLAIYRTIPAAGAVIHAHAFHVLPFCAARRPIQPVLEQTAKFGEIPLAPEAPAHSDALAAGVAAMLSEREAAIRVQAAAVLVPGHGIIVAGKDLQAAADALERIDWNAWCILAQGMMGSQ